MKENNNLDLFSIRPHSTPGKEAHTQTPIKVIHQQSISSPAVGLSFCPLDHAWNPCKGCKRKCPYPKI